MTSTTGILIVSVSAYLFLAIAAQAIRARFGSRATLISCVILADVALYFTPPVLGEYVDLLPHLLTVWLAAGLTCSIAVANDYMLRHFVKFSKVEAPAVDSIVLKRFIPDLYQSMQSEKTESYDHYLEAGSKISKTLAVFENPNLLVVDGYVSPSIAQSYVAHCTASLRQYITAEKTTFLFSCLYAFLKIARPSLFIIADSLIFAMLFWPLEVWRLLTQPAIKD